jgi:hypothetical protein
MTVERLLDDADTPRGWVRLAGAVVIDLANRQMYWFASCPPCPDYLGLLMGSGSRTSGLRPRSNRMVTPPGAPHRRLSQPTRPAPLLMTARADDEDDSDADENDDEPDASALTDPAGAP